MEFTIKQLLYRDRRFRNGGQDAVLYEPLKNDPIVKAVDDDKYVKLRSVWSKKVRFQDDAVERIQALETDFLKCLPDDLQRHVVLAGGAVLQAALTQQWHLNDVDVFVVGVKQDDTQAFIQRLVSAYSTVFDTKRAYRTSSSITLSIKHEDNYFSCSRLQIVLRLYSSLNELLYGFDLPCASMGLYNGKFVATELAWYTMNSGIMIVDSDRRSLTYGRRLKKYNNRGVQLLFPFLDTRSVLRKFQETRLDNRSYAVLQSTLHIPFRDSENMQVRLVRQFNQSTFQGYVHVSFVHAGQTVFSDYPVVRDLYDAIPIAIANGDEKQPEAFLPVDIDNVTGDIDIRNQPVQYNARKNPAFVRFLSRSEIENVHFDPIYRFKIRTQHPAAQWTSSFDPVVESPEAWYPPMFYNARVERTRVTDRFVILPECNNHSNYAYQAAVSMQKCLTKRPAWYFDDHQSIAVYINIVLIVIYQGFRPKNNRMTSEACQSLLGEMVAAYPQSSTGTTSLSSCIALVRKWIFSRYNPVHYGPKLDAIISDQMPLLLSLNIKQEHWKRLRQIVNQRSGPPNSFRYQTMCTVGSQYSMSDLRQQASYFNIDTTDKTRRQLCADIAMAVDQFIANANTASCDNADDFDLLGDAMMKDTPAFLRFTRKGANNKTYCFNVLDMYNSILAKVFRDPKGYEYTEDDMREITSRGKFLSKIMNLEDTTGFADRFRTYSEKHARTAERYANAINSMLAYTQMADTLVRLPIHILRFLVAEVYGTRGRKVPGFVLGLDRTDLFAHLYDLMNADDISVNVGVAMSETITTFYDEIEDIKEAIILENRQRASEI